MDAVCVFAGSSPGSDPAFAEAAALLGATVARSGLRLVYGGAHVGLMGVVANAALAEGGEVTGVIPRSLVDWEVAHTGLPDLRIVGSMHERKQLMADLSGGFIAMPGGIGTLEEFFEVLTWAQLGMHRKPCGLLNVSGFFDPLLAFLDSAVSHRFVRAEHRATILVESDPALLLERMTAFEPPVVAKWIDRTET